MTDIDRCDEHVRFSADLGKVMASAIVNEGEGSKMRFAAGKGATTTKDILFFQGKGGAGRSSSGGGGGGLSIMGGACLPTTLSSGN